MIGSLVSAWQVYLVMQLDNISIILCLLAGIGWLVLIPVWVESYTKTAPIVLTIAWVLCLLGAMLVPNTKTAAAMIVLPALTSEEVTEPVSREAKEIYTLAKSALINATTVDAAKVIEEEETEDEDAEEAQD